MVDKAVISASFIWVADFEGMREADFDQAGYPFNDHGNSDFALPGNSGISLPMTDFSSGIG